MPDLPPILCRACGAPLDAHGDVSLICPHCDTADELPRESHTRVRELRRRLRARAAGVVQLSERDATLVRIFEGSSGKRSIVLPYAFMAMLMLLFQIASYTHTPNTSIVIGSHLLELLLGLAVPIAALAGLTIGRRVYHGGLRDLLHAQPSEVPGGPARCRCCGAELPHEHGPLLRCRHCHTHSLVTPELLTRSSAVLACEIQAHRARLGLAGSHITAIGHAMDRILYLVMPAAFVMFIGLGQLLAWLLLPS